MSTLTVKSVFWNTHVINVFLNTYLKTSERQSVCASVRSITSLIRGGCDRRPIVNQSGFPPLLPDRPHDPIRYGKKPQKTSKNRGSRNWITSLEVLSDHVGVTDQSRVSIRTINKLSKKCVVICHQHTIFLLTNC